MIQQEMLHDGVAYLPKPFTPQELAATVRRILDRCGESPKRDR
jgi:DNA-binding response OmpR family regulator